MPSPGPGVVVVGAGLMGRWHAHAAARSGARVLAFVDPDVARARALAGRHPQCVASASFETALADTRPQIVHLCTPTATHQALAERALDAGCHLLVEKPLACDLASTRRILDLAASRRRLACPVHQFLFQRGVLQICEWLPRLGAVRHVDLVICSAGADGLGAAERDQIAIDVLPHPFSIAARLLGPAIENIPWRLEKPAPGELRVSGAANGSSVGILVSMSGRPTMNLLRVVTERGCLHADLFHGFATLEDATVSRTHKIVRPFTASGTTLMAAAANLTRRLVRSEHAYPGLRELVARFVRAVEMGGSSPISTAETLAVAAARDAVLLQAGAPNPA